MSSSTRARTEIAILFRLGCPVVMTYLASFAVPLITIINVGRRMSAAHLAGVSLGHMTFNITGSSVMIGLLSAMDTLCSQAFGAKNYREIGILLFRALIVCAFFEIFIAMLWLFGVSPILLALGQEEDVVANATVYCRCMTFGLPALVCFEALKRFLQSQNVVRPMLYVAVATVPPHFLFCWLFVGDEGPLSMGYVGAAVSNTLSFWLMLIMLSGYIYFWQPHDDRSLPPMHVLRPCGGQSSRRGSIRKKTFVLVKDEEEADEIDDDDDDDKITAASKGETLGDWLREASEWSAAKRFVRLGLAGTAMLALEWWSFEVLALGAGLMGTKVLAAHVVLANVVPLAFMVPLGLGTAASVRIGNLLGAADPANAKCAAAVSIAVVACLSVVASTTFQANGRAICALFSNDDDVVSLATFAVPAVAFFMILDYFQGNCQGIARGSGRQHQGAWIVVVGNWVVGIPLGMSLGLAPGASEFFGFGNKQIDVGNRTTTSDDDEVRGSLFGLWTGMCVGYVVVAILFSTLFCRMNWEAAKDDGDDDADDEQVELSHGVAMTTTMPKEEEEEDGGI